MPVTLYAHLTWTTHEREPLIDSNVEQFLMRFLPGVASRFGVTTIEVAAPSDHVHMLLLLPGVFDVPRFTQALKGTSARIANRDGVGSSRLRWASGYDMRSVSPGGWLRVREYIAKQKRRPPDEESQPA